MTIAKLIEQILNLKMKWRYFYRFVPAALACLILLLLLRHALLPKQTAILAADHTARQTTSSSHTATSPTSSSKPTPAKKATTPSTINWHNPSQNKPYPNVAEHPNLAFDVDTTAQRVYLRDHNKTLYTMYASTGLDHSTPVGTYAIQAERGASFYNAKEQMGAHYYTSWLDHGKYLFHSVPTDASGNYIPAEAAKLGRAPASHGCVRVSVADAKWILNNAKVGMRVKVY